MELEDEFGLTEDAADGEYEVDEILRYWKDDDGEECFLVKWYGFPLEAATWEPLEHLGSGCIDFIHEARKLFEAVEEGLELPAGNADEDGGDFEDGGDDQRETDDDAPARSRSADNPALARIAALLGGGDSEDVLDADGADVLEPTPPSMPPPKRRKLDEPPMDEPLEEEEEDEELEEPEAPPLSRTQSIPPGVCRFCKKPQTREDAPGEAPRKVGYTCPRCRLQRVDDFHPACGGGLLGHTFASETGTARFTFQANPMQWKSQKWSLYACAVSLKSCELGGPAWPYMTHAKLNGKHGFNVEPPPHLHKRKEQCYDITQKLKQGNNTLEFRFQPDPEQPPAQRSRYCIGVVLTRQQNVNSMVAQVKSKSKMPASWGEDRVKRLLGQAARKDRASKDIEVTGTFGRSLKPVCPVSFSPIELPAVGRECKHLQVFDLEAYISVNHGISSLDKRWVCPVCSLNTRPDDIVLDTFTMDILKTLKGKEDTVEALVFEADGSYEVQDVVAGSSGGGTVKPPEESIDLSESD